MVTCWGLPITNVVSDDVVPLKCNVERYSSLRSILDKAVMAKMAVWVVGVVGGIEN